LDIFKKKFTVAFTFEEGENENEVFFSEQKSEVFDELNYEIVTNKNTKIFKNEDKDNFIINILNSFFKEDTSISKGIFQREANKIYKKLIDSQQNKKGTKNKKITPGTLLISFNLINDIKYAIISLLEPIKFITQEFKKEEGFPVKKNILKSCFVYYKNGIIDNDEIYLIDSSGRIAKYWSENFLNLTQVNDDKINTKNSFREIDNIIYNLDIEEKEKIKAVYQSFFLENEIFTVDKLEERLLNIKNIDKEDIKKLTKDIRAKFSKKHIDKNFDIDHKSLNRFYETYEITERTKLMILDKYEPNGYYEENNGKFKIVIKGEKKDLKNKKIIDALNKRGEDI
jgi:hypothetical protein